MGSSYKKPTPSKAEINRQSEHLTRSEMKEWLRSTYGIPASKFDATMRQALPLESHYQERLLGWLRRAYPQGFAWKAAAGPYSRGGIPDVCAVINGRFYGFEVKRPYIGELSRLQEETLEAIKKAGGKAAVVSFPKDALEVIENE